ncbi:Gly-Xaa-Xaa repeat protein, partial [Bacillus toyonensis]|uniref:Gly-Xaa-Xaa repeat protein n=1 Tax=Bacillus toyonensis TaxID=155322 RepID=UPI000BFAC48B
GPTGVTGPAIIATFADITQTGSETVVSNGAVTFSSIQAINNITFNGTDTLTIIDGGIYKLEFYISIDPGGTAPIVFSFEINGVNTNQRSMGISVTTGGLLSNTSINNFNSGTTIRVVNVGTSSVSIPDTTTGGNGRQSARFVIYRIF